MDVLRIERYWQVATTVPEIETSLSKPAVINGFVKIMFSSLDPRVLRATVFLLSELTSRDKAVIQTLTRVESDVECIITLFKKGLLEAVVLIYLLKLPWSSLGEMDMIEPLRMVIKKKDGDVLDMCLRPKTASVLLGQILREVDDHETGKVARTIISERAIESIVGSLEADSMKERISAVGILLKCHRWDLGAMEQLPEYMKVYYCALLTTVEEVADELALQGCSYHIDYLKEASLPAQVFVQSQANPKDVASIILCGGVGTRLFPLTRRRAKPAACQRLRVRGHEET